MKVLSKSDASLAREDQDKEKVQAQRQTLKPQQDQQGINNQGEEQQQLANQVPPQPQLQQQPQQPQVIPQQQQQQFNRQMGRSINDINEQQQEQQPVQQQPEQPQIQQQDIQQQRQAQEAQQQQLQPQYQQVQQQQPLVQQQQPVVQQPVAQQQQQPVTQQQQQPVVQQQQQPVAHQQQQPVAHQQQQPMLQQQQQPVVQEQQPAHQQQGLPVADMVIQQQQQPALQEQQQQPDFIQPLQPQGQQGNEDLAQQKKLSHYDDEVKRIKRDVENDNSPISENKNTNESTINGKIEDVVKDEGTKVKTEDVVQPPADDLNKELKGSKDVQDKRETTPVASEKKDVVDAGKAEEGNASEIMQAEMKVRTNEEMRRRLKAMADENLGPEKRLGAADAG